MFNLSGSEWLLYGGIVVMIISVVLAGGCIAVFIITGRRLSEKLDQEYGNPLS